MLRQDIDEIVVFSNKVGKMKEINKWLGVLEPLNSVGIDSSQYFLKHGLNDYPIWCLGEISMPW